MSSELEKEDTELLATDECRHKMQQNNRIYMWTLWNRNPFISSTDGGLPFLQGNILLCSSIITPFSSSNIFQRIIQHSQFQDDWTCRSQSRLCLSSKTPAGVLEDMDVPDTLGDGVKWLERWPETLCVNFKMIGHVEVSQDSACPPQLQQESKRTRMFLIHLHIVSLVVATQYYLILTIYIWILSI